MLVAAIYVTLSWLIYLLPQTWLAALASPQVRDLIPALLLVGFPLAIFYSWTGTRRKAQQPHTKIPNLVRRRNRRVKVTLAIVLTVSLAFLAREQLKIVPASSALGKGSEVIDDLADGRPVAEGSLVVLPLDPRPAHEDEIFLSGALSDSLYLKFSSVAGLQLTSRLSARASGTHRMIAEKLRVAHILSGDLRMVEDGLIVSVKLASAQNGRELWAEDLVTDKAGLEDLANTIVSTVAVQLSLDSPESRGRLAEVNWPQKALFYQGRQFALDHDPLTLHRAEASLVTALDQQQNFAEAYAFLSGVYLDQTLLGLKEAPGGYEMARKTAQNAVDLAPDLARAWTVLGRISANVDWDWVAAEEAIAGSLILAPAAISGLSTSGSIELTLGRTDTAVELYTRVVALDPLTLGHRLKLGIALEAAGEYKPAIRVYRQLMIRAPDYPGVHTYLGRALIANDQARSALLHMELEKHPFWSVYGNALALISLGRDEEWMPLLAVFEESYASEAAYQIAELYTHAGQSDRAFEWFDQAVQNHDPGLALLIVNPFLEPLADDPRWLQLLYQVNLGPRSATSP